MKTLIKMPRWTLLDTGTRYELITGSYESTRLIFAWEYYHSKPTFADCVAQVEKYLKGQRNI